MQLREPGPALSYLSQAEDAETCPSFEFTLGSALSQAVLALRSAAGRLCPQQAAEAPGIKTLRMPWVSCEFFGYSSKLLPGV